MYLLLKSSDFVTSDLEMACEGLSRTEDEEEGGGKEEEEGEGEEEWGDVVGARRDGTMPPRDFEYELVLRKWCNLHPSMEFRCFVYDGELGESLPLSPRLSHALIHSPQFIDPPPSSCEKKKIQTKHDSGHIPASS